MSLRQALERLASWPTNWQNEKYIAPLRDFARATLEGTCPVSSEALERAQIVRNAATALGLQVDAVLSELEAACTRGGVSPSGKETEKED